MKDKARQAANLILAFLQPIVAIMVNLEVTGPSIGAISAKYPTYVVPAGYAFSIWTLIFALTLGYAIWQALPSQRHHAVLRRVGWWTASALACTSIWMLIFQRSFFIASVLVMLWLLISLSVILFRRRRYLPDPGGTEKWLVRVTFSIFLGWITIATVANIWQTLSAYGWSGFGVAYETWAIASLIAAGVVAAIVTFFDRGNLGYALTVIWAMVGIAINQYTAGVETSSPTVGLVAVLSIGMLVVVTIAARIRNRSVPFSSANGTTSFAGKARPAHQEVSS